MNDIPHVDAKLLAEAADGIIADALITTVTMLSKSTVSSNALEVTASFMTLIQQVCMKACLFTGLGDKDLALKAADLLHSQVVRSINTIEGNDDETTNN